MAVAVIAFLVLGSLAIVLPAIFSGSGPSTNSDLSVQVTVTPGAQEAEMRARLQKDPNDVNAMVILAGLLANDGSGEEANQWYEKAVNARPNDVALRIAFGQTLTEYGYPLDAELQLKKAEELAPTDPEPVYLLGQLYQQQQPPRTADAKKMYEQVINMAPDSVYASRAKDQLDQLNQGS